MKAVFDSMTDIGLHRDQNDDSCYFHEQKRFMLVADGMGGYSGGNIASAIATDIFRLHFMGVNQDNYREEFQNLFTICNDEVIKAAEENETCKDMGTTLTAVAFDNEHYYIAHMGDSRCYLFRKGKLYQLTSDHNIVSYLLANGKITEEEAKIHPGKSMLTRCIGRAPMSEVDFCEGEIQEGDIFLLCTDGVSGVLTDKELVSCLGRSRFGLPVLNKIVNKVLAKDGSDNITAVMGKITK